MAKTIDVHECFGDCLTMYAATHGICWLCKKTGVKTKYSKQIFVEGQCNGRICDECASQQNPDELLPSSYEYWR